MTIEETREKILTDDAFVVSETDKIRYLYTLKHEIRFARTREEEIYTESVAEHVYGMHMVANYFLPLEDSAGEWNWKRVYEMITWHDTDEIETGDSVSFTKTDADRKRGQEAIPIMLKKVPAHMKSNAETILAEFEDQQTIESRFVKAIDKIESSIEVFDDNYRPIMHHNGESRTIHNSIKFPYTKDFPYINRFAEVIANNLEQRGFFAPEA